MALNLEQKKKVVAEVAEMAADSLSIVAAEYLGLTVSEMTDLRLQGRETGVSVRVVRNTLAKRALDGTDFSCINDKLTGPLILAFSKEDPGSAARLFKNFAEEHENLVVKALAIEGKAFEASDIDVLANLPTREQALVQLLATMQAPVAKFVRTLAEPNAKLARTLAAVGNSKQQAA